MHIVEAKGILSAKNGMNLYRGCSHGCIYCDSRSSVYHMDHDFEDIEIKGNAIELLEAALKRKRSKCMLGTGSMTDPYIPIERKIGNVRKALELVERYGYGFSLTPSGCPVRGRSQRAEWHCWPWWCSLPRHFQPRKWRSAAGNGTAHRRLPHQ